MSLNEQFTSDNIYSMAVHFDLKVCQPLARLVCSWQRLLGRNILLLSIIYQLCIARQVTFPYQKKTACIQCYFRAILLFSHWQLLYPTSQTTSTETAQDLAHTEHARYFAAHHFVMSNNTLQRLIVVTVLLWQCLLCFLTDMVVVFLDSIACTFPLIMYVAH